MHIDILLCFHFRRIFRFRGLGALSGRRSFSMTALDAVDGASDPRATCELLQISSDGTQVVELKRPPHRPYGFYIARGNANYNHGLCIQICEPSCTERFRETL